MRHLATCLYAVRAVNHIENHHQRGKTSEGKQNHLSASSHSTLRITFGRLLGKTPVQEGYFTTSLDYHHQSCASISCVYQWSRLWVGEGWWQNVLACYISLFSLWYCERVGTCKLSWQIAFLSRGRIKGRAFPYLIFNVSCLISCAMVMCMDVYSNE